ncbi:hypothetical protein BDB00DRAFT_509974 [Zychaea mexicana]|uniref:uncharacterized protein n=1 Tax=Zychaea mexicana TaxID=64656 RepID=UPI0022FE91F9|nr:uncharacterized protein BDB00DRAFT_509974 [Zychaea mexicana]KAI9491320.1 hypothetical protein BDB00DRAFT_509974 [Zychaea mexicana]
MGDIFNRLPFELICTIFVLVGQQACLESMRVCQKWFDQVPRHSTGVWKQVDFYYVWTKTNPCLIQCLGPHVQDVDVAYDRLDLLVRILKNRQCTISSLSKSCSQLFTIYSVITFTTVFFFLHSKEISVCDTGAISYPARRYYT